jgi:phage repressor protein C with HTH and peptisase S24 domain
MVQTIKERTIEFIKYKKISVKEFEVRCGLSNGYVANMRKGYSAEKLKDVLSAYPELNRDWLLYNEGEMLKEQPTEPPPQVVEVVEHGTPVYDIDATCGDLSRPIVFTDEHIIGHVNLPNVSPNAVIIRANGDSMEPHIHDGDWIAVREVANLNVLYYGQVYLVITNEYRLLKYLRRDEDEQHYVILRSANKEYDDIRLPKADIRHLFIVENILSLHIKL